MGEGLRPEGGGGGTVPIEFSIAVFCLFVFFNSKFNILLLFCIISIHKIMEKSISKQSALSLFLIGKCIILILLRCQDYRYPSDSPVGPNMCDVFSHMTMLR